MTNTHTQINKHKCKNRKADKTNHPFPAQEAGKTAESAEEKKEGNGMAKSRVNKMHSWDTAQNTSKDKSCLLKK